MFLERPFWGRDIVAMADLSILELLLDGYTDRAIVVGGKALHPAMPCILTRGDDEVDTMLDEANVRCFSVYFQELARTTQFIVIIHNRGTVEVAEMIYSVSRGEEDVSQLPY